MRIAMVVPVGILLAYEKGKQDGKEILIQDLKKVNSKTHMEKCVENLLRSDAVKNAPGTIRFVERW